jgi:hypothetical protein
MVAPNAVADPPLGSPLTVPWAPHLGIKGASGRPPGDHFYQFTLVYRQLFGPIQMVQIDAAVASS